MLKRLSIIVYIFVFLFILRCGEESNNYPPNQPGNPNPSDGETGVHLGVVLNWDCSDKDNNKLKYDVYFGTSYNPPLVASGITESYYDPEGDLSKNTKYYWRVVASDGKYEIEGLLWSFTTGGGELIWRYKTDNYVVSSPYIIDGRVYIGSDDCNIYCLSADDGSLIWEYQTGSYVESSPWVVDGRVFIGSDDNYIYCLSASDGSLIWRCALSGQVYSSPFVDGEKVYIGSDDGYVYCLSSGNGSLIWKFMTGGYVESSPYVVDNLVYVGSNDGCIYCLSADSGDIIWKYKTDGKVRSSPYVINNRIYVGSDDGYIYCLSAEPDELFNSWGFTMNNMIDEINMKSTNNNSKIDKESYKWILE